MEAAAFLTEPFLGQPVWAWLAFATVVVALLVFDLGVLHRKEREIPVGESLLLSAGYIAVALMFGGLVWWQLGAQSGIDYFTGYLIEKTLSLDNVFVISLIFAALAVPRALQHRVLFYGILGVVVMRAIVIGFGASLVAEFEWILFLFGGFLILTGIKMLVSAGHDGDMKESRLLAFLKRRMRLTDGLRGSAFVVREADSAGRLRLYATPLLLALVMVELVDVLFAVDSVPAILAITTDPYVVYTSNIFAILGLRALYFALAATVHRFHYLKYALAVVLVFIGAKIFVNHFYGKLDPAISLGVTVALLAGGIAYSLWKTRKERGPDAGAAALPATREG
ncbi:MAG: TerC family protein [Bauldia sp.]|nr:TerC family protein [Bauldia sp.]